MKEAIAADIKESVCRVYDGAFDEEATKNMPTVAYELPDGQEIQVPPSPPLHTHTHPKPT